MLSKVFCLAAIGLVNVQVVLGAGCPNGGAALGYWNYCNNAFGLGSGTFCVVSTVPTSDSRF